ncbi:hypothetical protein BU16DRAFT_615460 [Lophium mytilinum]|uniref:Uncharacterized protein n=1 Tax=Lophium mytilinum TaxID=390894 RepID=A0A6A6R4Q1_9PEZI|nr:hypothetical protein BU16DRAFT_615460 [Lophium mytilinum]
MSPAARSPALASKIATMRLKICPIVSVMCGQASEHFPGTMLEFWLLTEAQLDGMAHFYSQSTPDEFTNLYPRPMKWDKDFLSTATPKAMSSREKRYRLNIQDRMAIKRRKFAKFIGMRGCETPGWEVRAHLRALESRIMRIVEEEERTLKRKRC